MAKWFSNLFLSAALAAVSAAPASAGGRNFGIGVVVPAPTGISAKLWTSGTTAFDFVFGWSNAYGDGYYDDRCYDGAFYRNNRGYCDSKAFDWRDYDGRYYRGRYRGYRTFHAHADYLFHNFRAIQGSEKFPLHYGPGINLDYYRYEELILGVRGNFGISWLPRKAPMDVFLELAPIVNLFPVAFFDVNAGLGTRFYF